MSTGAIIGLIVLVLIALAAWLVMSKFSKTRQREREIERRNKAIENRREEVVGEERSAAEERRARAERAEQMARMERAAAEQHAARADLHREGHLDSELERDVESPATDDKGRAIRDEHGRPMTGTPESMADSTREPTTDTGDPQRADLRSQDDATIGSDAADTEFERGRRFEREQEERTSGRRI